MGIKRAMHTIIDGAEHQFLTFLEKLRVNPSGWIACSFPFSRHIVHEDIVGRRAFIKSDMTRLRSNAAAFLQSFRDTGGALPGAQL